MSEFIEVKSSNIEAISYDPKTMQMKVKFKGGNVYAYEEVSEEVSDNFIRAKSVGSYFYHYIKGKYESKKIASVEVKS